MAESPEGAAPEPVAVDVPALIMATGPGNAVERAALALLELKAKADGVPKAAAPPG